METGSIRTQSTQGTNLRGDRLTPLDIAQQMGHDALNSQLTPKFTLNVSDSQIENIETQFHQLICDEMGWYNDGSVALPQIGVLREGNNIGYFPVNPGVDKEVSLTPNANSDNGFWN
jgi:hypothetical protein